MTYIMQATAPSCGWSDDPVSFVPVVAPHVGPSPHAWHLPRLVGVVSTGLTIEVRGRKVSFPPEISRDEAEEWRRVAEARRKLAMTTAADYRAGGWSCDAVYVLEPNISGMEPILREVWDFGADTDNGHVRLVLARDRWVHPDTIVFLMNAAREEVEDEWERERNMREDHRIMPAPGFTEVPRTSYRTSLRSLVVGGSLAVAEDPDDFNTLRVVWRRDGRSKDGHVLSIHDQMGHAEAALDRIAALLNTGNLPLPKEPWSRSPRYDGQKAKVYRWDAAVERRFPKLVERIDLETCQRWADLACAAAGVPKLTVAFNDRLERKCYYKAGAMQLAPWGRTVGTVLHEAGHHVVAYDGTLLAKRLAARRDGCEQRRVEPHGPEYVGWMLRLYTLVEGVSREALLEEAERIGLEWQEMADGN